MRARIDGVRERSREQVAVLEGDVLIVERVGCLRLLQADDERRPILDDRDFGRAVVASTHIAEQFRR